MPVIIDGYNLLWYIQEKDEQFESITDIQLCRLVGQYLKLIGQKGEIVFDGTGNPNVNYLSGSANLDIIFVGLGTDADTVIESKIKVSTAPGNLTIVSSDRRIRQAAKTRKATDLKAEGFWNNLQKTLKRKTKFREPSEKRSGLDKGGTEFWLKYFGLEQ